MRVWWVVVCVSIPVLAAAQPAPPSTTLEPSPRPRVWIGGNIAVGLGGSATYASGGTSTTVDANPGVGVEGILDIRINDHFTIGGAARMFPSVKLAGSPTFQSGTGPQFDIRARVTAGSFVSPTLHLHGIGELGYSYIKDVFRTGDLAESGCPSSGPAFGIGTGARLAVTPRLMLSAEAILQVGFQSPAPGYGVDPASDSFFVLGFGALLAID